MSKTRFKSRPSAAIKRGRRSKSARPEQNHEDHEVRPRLQKVLAAAGLGSRRQCEEIIVLGRVEVDRRVVKELGTRVDPVAQEIRVDGEPLPRPKRQYFMLNKPMGVVSTARDPAGRPRVTDLVKSSQRLFPIGRLDISSEGLILVTNDGELANLLAHPRYEVEKTYLAQVVGAPSRESLAKLEHGVHLAEGYAHAKRVRIKSQHKQSSTLEIVLDEGRNREVRRLLARVGHKVLRLKRVAIGSLRLGNLLAGEFRPLRPDEVRELKESALATSKRERRAPSADKPESTTRRGVIGGLTPPRSPAMRSGNALVPPPADDLEEAISEGFDDNYQPPQRPGTIIGAEEIEQSKPRDRVRDPEEVAKGSPARRAASVKPIIDVRRGIFPGRNNDDFDDDELEEAPPSPPVASPKKLPQKLPKKSKERSRGKRPSFQSKDANRANRRGADRGSKPAGRRKGRRR